ncbi:MAG: SH3 domain-containing protein [Planctomycetota bacterium]
MKTAASLLSALLLCLVLLPLPRAAAQTEAVAPTSPPSAVEGTITGDRVNVRPQPSLESGWLYQAFRGEKVVAVARQGEWVEILLPEKTYAWIAKEYIQKRPDSDRGVVKGDRVALRAGSGGEYDRIGIVNSGYLFLILGEADNYYKVQPLPSATAFIHGNYVQLSGSLAGAPGPEAPAPPETAEGQPPAVPPTPATQPAPLTEGEKLLADAVSLAAQEDGKPSADRDYSKAVSILVEIINRTAETDPFLNLKARKTLAEVWQKASVREVGVARQERMAEIERKLEEIRQKWAGSRPAVDVPQQASGTLDRFKLPFPPATHKLVVAGRIVSLLYSDTVDLNQYVGKEVGVSGKVEAKKDLAVPLIKVDAIAEVAK